jgi:hypothetical protein
MTTIADLAKMMNVTEADVAGFVACLRVWLAKGYTFDQAIERHMAQMHRFVNRDAAEIVEAFRPVAIAL